MEIHWNNSGSALQEWNDNGSALQDWNDHMVWIFLPSAVLLVICFVLGVTTNSVIILVYIFRMRNSRDDRYFIPYISSVDLFGLLINCANSWLMYFPYAREDPREAAIICKVSWFSASFIASMSSLIFLAIALQRYLKICRPYGKQMELKHRRGFLIISCFLSVIIVTPFIFFYGSVRVRNDEYNVTAYICSGSKDEQTQSNGPVIYSIVIAALIFLNILSLSVFYCFIGRTIIKQTQTKKRRQLSAKRRVNLVTMGTVNYENVTFVPDETTLQNDNVSEYDETTLGRRCHIDQEACNEVSVNEAKSFGESSMALHCTDNKKKAKEKSKSLQHQMRLNRRIDRFTNMFLMITSVYMISYIPKAVLLITESLDSQFWLQLPDTERSVIEVIYKLHVLQHTCNAFIVVFFDKRFRNEIFRTCCLCKQN